MTTIWILHQEWSSSPKVFQFQPTDVLRGRRPIYTSQDTKFQIVYCHKAWRYTYDHIKSERCDCDDDSHIAVWYNKGDIPPEECLIPQMGEDMDFFRNSYFFCFHHKPTDLEVFVHTTSKTKLFEFVSTLNAKLVPECFEKDGSVKLQ